MGNLPLRPLASPPAPHSTRGCPNFCGRSPQCSSRKLSSCLGEILTPALLPLSTNLPTWKSFPYLQFWSAFLTSLPDPLHAVLVLGSQSPAHSGISELVHKPHKTLQVCLSSASKQSEMRVTCHSTDLRERRSHEYTETEQPPAQSDVTEPHTPTPSS